MSKLPDPFRDGMARGWKVTNGEQNLPERITCDVAIIGSGAGAGITAEMLTKAGLDVVILEEGPLRTSTDFRQREAEAYADLYQDSAARRSADKAVNILQGRCVGGTTVVNWTSSFHTPTKTLEFWQKNFGLSTYTEQEMAPWFAQAETRLNIAPWQVAPNENNETLRRGATKLGIEAHVIPRNVKGCWNLGSCGMGCPTNAKQSMLVTTIPTALDGGARLFHNTRVDKLRIEGNKVQGLVCHAVKVNGDRVSDKTMEVVAKHVVLSAGAINSPAVLLRSKAPDPHDTLGKRTFLHPVAFTAALFDHKVEGWAGAPQSIYADHFLYTQAMDGPIGYKLEAPPIHPGLISVLLGSYGVKLRERMENLPNTQFLLALLRDGFHDEAAGGIVTLNVDGATPKLDYPLTPYIMDGVRRAMLTMAEVQFAAGARKVLPCHEHGELYTSWEQAKAALTTMPMKPQLALVGSAHVMGGCRMGGKEDIAVVKPDGQHWQVENLSVHDGSVFPTSIGANPQLSVYGTTARMSAGLVKRLTGKDVVLA
ncbi:MAG: GMC family oxidoreductase [Aquabacterium sp.]|jgi:choline dehydrogenase-like flavoprotein|nr:MAG: GMC family oxidoreductase [Aquabacterium sp.]